jgi:glycosyltransferase involved in cell wall biosynthesis
VLQRSFHLIVGAAEAFDVDLVTFCQTAFHPDESSLAAARQGLKEYVRILQVCDLPADRGRVSRAWLLGTSAFARTPYTIRWNSSRSMWKALRAISSSNRYDLVHFDTIGMFQYRNLFPDSAWVLNHHNIESHLIERRSQGAGVLARSYLRWEATRLARWERIHGAEADLHLAVSDLDVDRLRRVIGDAPAAVIENAVDTEFFRPTEGRQMPGHIVFAGRIDAYANAEAVRWMRDEIWPQLRAGSARSVAIIGRSPPPDIISWGHSAPDVEVTGYVDDVRPYLDAGEVYLCPIRDGGGTRLKLLDAMSMGLPIVSHRMAIEGLSVVPGEHLLVADDAEGLISHVEALLADPERRKKIGRNARARAEELYGAPAVRRRLVAAYRDTLDRRARRS